MEPFTIQCSTCQSRIRVKNPNMIGQVVNCPKCNSLVMVAPPHQIKVENPEGISVDSMAMTKDGIAPDLVPPSPDLADAAPTSRTRSELGHSQESEQSPSGSLADEGYRLSPVEDDLADLANSEVRPGGMDEVAWQNAAAAAESPLLPSDEWTSAGSARMRQYLLVGFLGLSGVVLAAVGFIAFLQWYGNRSPEPAGVSPSPEMADASRADPVGEVEDPVALDEPSDASSSLSEDASSTKNPDTSLSAAEERGVDASSAASESVDPQTVDQNAGSDQNTGVAAQTGVDTSAASAGAGPLLESESTASSQGLSELPESLRSHGEVSAGADARDGGPVDPNQQVRDSLPNAWLQQFAPMLEWQVVPTLPDTGQALAPPPITAEDLGLGSDGGREPIPDIDWSIRSQTFVPGLILSTQQPLSQAIDLWTHLSGAPTIIDLDSLTAANRDWNLAIDFGKVQSATLGQIAERLASTLDLELNVKQNSYLEFRAPEDRIRPLLPNSIPITGMGDAGTGADWLLEALNQLFPRLEGAWTLDKDGLNYDPNRVDLMTWFEVVRFVDNLRAARSQPTIADAYDAGRLRQPFVEPDKLDFLDTRISEISPQARPVGQILSRICGRVGVQCWLDWPSLGKSGIGPGTTSLVVTSDRTVRQILANYADQFSLVFAIQDENSLWVTTQQAYRHQPRVYVLPSQGRTIEQWEQRLRDYIPLNEQGVGELVVIPAPDSEFMIVKCCRPRLEL